MMVHMWHEGRNHAAYNVGPSPGIPLWCLSGETEFSDRSICLDSTHYECSLCNLYWIVLDIKDFLSIHLLSVKDHLN